MTAGDNEQIHATCVAIGGEGIVLRGPSGSGKSDLAIRLIGRGARLIADDRVDLSLAGGRLHAAAPANLFGMIEVRGLGILRLPAAPAAPVALICDLVDEAAIERLPETRTETLLGHGVTAVSLAPFHASAVTKVQLALGLATGAIMRVDDAT